MPIEFSPAMYSGLLRPPKSVAEYDAEAQDAKINALRQQGMQMNLLSGQRKMAADDQAMQDENALRAVYASMPADDNSRIAALQSTGLPAGYSAADALRKAMQERLKQQTEIDKATTQTEGYGIDNKIKVHAFQVQQLANVGNVPQALAWAKQGLDSGAFTPEQYQRGVQNLQQIQTPEQFAQWRQQALAGGTTAQQQLQAQADAEKQAKLDRHNLASEGVARGMLGVAQGNLSERRQENARAAKNDGNPPQRAAGPMSVTLQKELIESDDAAQAARAVLGTIEAAKKINNDAYSGYGAKQRAVIMSNLGGTESADATINIDNMMTGQALESLKLVFGGMPTEGERKILLEMQASVDKTPKQREDILNRATAAAQRRLKFAESKAAAIRNGSYLTEGAPVPPPGSTVQVPTAADIAAELARRGIK